jgi:hypothetical protein
MTPLVSASSSAAWEMGCGIV